jgi:hypothetical protein
MLYIITMESVTMRSQPRRGLWVVALAAAGALLAACSDRMSPAPPPLSQAQADSIGSVVTADVENELDAGTAASGIGFVPGAPFSGSPLSLSTCQPQIAPTPAVNSDADRVPDSIRVTFADCVIGFRRGADTVRGVIDIVDPTPQATDGSVKLVFASLARIFVGRDGQWASVTQNGSREAIRDADTLSQTETGFRTDYVFGNGATVTHVRDWSIVFGADVAGSIVRDAPLPSGTLSIDGSSTIARNGTTTFDLQVSTPTVLHYNASCSDRPRFDTGTLIAMVTRQGTTTTVTIAFTACGQYTVTRS